MRRNAYDFVRKMVLTLLGVAIITHLSAAQSGTWESVKQLPQGQEVKVVLNHGKSYRGTMQSASDEAVVVSSSGGSQTFGQQDVRRVLSRSRGHRGRHILIGLGLGAGAGVGVGAGIDGEQGHGAWFPNAGKEIFTPVGAVLGAVIGAALPASGWHEVYRK
jgi:hypothetical protein